MPSKKSESWRARDRAALWHPFTQQSLWNEEDFPVIARGKGAWLEDVDGNKYIDGVSSLWCNIHGHARPEINRAMKAQLDKLSHATFLGLSNPPAIELGERLLKIAPKGLSRVFYSDNGSTAVEVACKMAFQYWAQNGKPAKRKFVAFEASYHGDTLGAVALGGIDLYHGIFKPLLFPTIKAPTTYAYRCDKARSLAECGSHALEDLEAILRTHARELAGLVIEPLVQGAGGMITQPPGFLKAVRRLCDEYEILLIADEVMTGFGRTGTMFACEQEGVSPDLLALSKGLTSGYLPLAVTLATERIYEGFLGAFKDRRTFFHGHTYTGNPLACAGALASLDLFKKDRTLETAAKRIHRFGNLLQEFYRIERVGEVRQRGLIAGIELVADPKTRAPFPWEERRGHRAALAARKRGVLLRPLGDTIVLMPPLAIKEKDLETLVDVALEAVKEVVA
jgi:adenosylmethionine-8-amino-7-oxononanoate aminotransferase